MKPAVLAPGAQAELEGAAEWYEGRREGLALRFLSHVDHALTAIEETPSAFPRWEHDPRFRKFVLQRFPYLVFYRELGDRGDRPWGARAWLLAKAQVNATLTEGQP